MKTTLKYAFIFLLLFQTRVLFSQSEISIEQNISVETQNPKVSVNEPQIIDGGIEKLCLFIKYMWKCVAVVITLLLFFVLSFLMVFIVVLAVKIFAAKISSFSYYKCFVPEIKISASDNFAGGYSYESIKKLKVNKSYYIKFEIKIKKKGFLGKLDDTIVYYYITSPLLTNPPSECCLCDTQGRIKNKSDKNRNIFSILASKHPAASQIIYKVNYAAISLYRDFYIDFDKPVHPSYSKTFTLGFIDTTYNTIL